MNIKILLIIIIILLVAVIGFFIFENTFNSDKIYLEKTQFTLPEGYSKIKSDNGITISNGTTTLFVKDYDGTNVTKFIDNYLLMKNDTNNSVSIVKMDVGNFTVSKSTVTGDGKTVHYWFNHDDKVYEIYTWSGDSKTDQVVKMLIQSIK